MLPSLRLPSRFELELIGLAVLIFFVAAYKREREKVAHRDALLAARPAIDEARRAVEVRSERRGPVITTRRFAPPPAGCPGAKPVLAEEKVEEGPSFSDMIASNEAIRQETPVAPPPAPQPWRALVLELAPKSKHTAARFDVDLGRLRLSARHGLPYAGELRLEPWVGIGFRF